jgi:hypothetical protein
LKTTAMEYKLSRNSIFIYFLKNHLMNSFLKKFNMFFQLGVINFNLSSFLQKQSFFIVILMNALILNNQTCIEKYNSEVVSSNSFITLLNAIIANKVEVKQLLENKY